MKKNQQPLKRAVIKEELVELTGDFLSAVIINQFIYWSERVRDYDQMLKEEKERLQILGENNDKYDFKNGWIFKTASELNEEIMTGKSDATIRRRIDKLVENEWIKRRRNPKNKQDRTYQYRVDIIKIQKDLLELGYSLDKYPLLVDEISNLQNADSNLHDESSNLQNADSSLQNADSSLQNAGTVPEITTETTSNNNNNNKIKISKKISNNFKKAFGQSLNEIQKQSLIQKQESGLTEELLIKVIEMCGMGGHNQTYFFRKLSMLVRDNIKTIQQLEKTIKKPSLKRASGQHSNSQDNEYKNNSNDYKWADFFIDYDKYKE
ncbi:hypothetical protein LJ207_10555 [Halanaerobium sp. Z-7514]|uniref:Uncharacterized protein n=1 Tax=Halanaerobium polyolivorans TaxID=2886943 RepID=A0AAW4X1Q1_9FIRM|nr:hypothetical protein [Halanaerobium polyolivorans]MCC3145764.1 hypothetical protein [Halanaerobium polyolivorans]